VSSAMGELGFIAPIAKLVSNSGIAERPAKIID
jgi:hypothetical protein